LIGGHITFERRTVQGTNESAKMLMILNTSWLIGLKSKALHGLFGQRSDDAIHLAAARARCLNGQMGCVR
jgi:predicted nucleic acid-binding protein